MYKAMALFCLFLTGVIAVSAQPNQKLTGIDVYYFHGTHRCTTCNAVEKVTRETLKQFYGDKLVLQSLNREEAKNSALVKKFQVSGQTLLIVKGDKKVDLTNLAFMNAERSPYRLKAKIRETIDQMQ